MRPFEDDRSRDDWTRGRALAEQLLGDSSGQSSARPSGRVEGRAERARTLAEGIVWLRAKIARARLA